MNEGFKVAMNYVLFALFSFQEKLATQPFFPPALLWQCAAAAGETGLGDAVAGLARRAQDQSRGRSIDWIP